MYCVLYMYLKCDYLGQGVRDVTWCDIVWILRTKCDSKKKFKWGYMWLSMTKCDIFYTLLTQYYPVQYKPER